MTHDARTMIPIKRHPLPPLIVMPPLAVDSGCHGFDLDCVAKAGKEIIGDGARVAAG